MRHRRIVLVVSSNHSSWLRWPAISLHVVSAQREVRVFYGIALITAKQADVRSGRAYVKGDVIAGRRTRRGILAFLLLPDHRDRAFFWRVEPPSPV